MTHEQLLPESNIPAIDHCLGKLASFEPLEVTDLTNRGDGVALQALEVDSNTTSDLQAESGIDYPQDFLRQDNSETICKSGIYGTCD